MQTRFYDTEKALAIRDKESDRELFDKINNASLEQLAVYAMSDNPDERWLANLRIKKLMLK